MTSKRDKYLTIDEVKADESLLDEFVTGYDKLIISLIKRHTPVAYRSPDFEDYIQVGRIAVYKAYENFDPGMGFKFSAYVTSTIVGNLRNYRRDTMFTSTAPSRLRSLCIKIMPSVSNGMSTYDLAEEAGVEVDMIIEALMFMKSPSYLDQTVGDNETDLSQLLDCGGGEFVDDLVEDLHLKNKLEIMKKVYPVGYDVMDILLNGGNKNHIKKKYVIGYNKVTNMIDKARYVFTTAIDMHLDGDMTYLQLRKIGKICKENYTVERVKEIVSDEIVYNNKGLNKEEVVMATQSIVKKENTVNTLRVKDTVTNKEYDLQEVKEDLLSMMLDITAGVANFNSTTTNTTNIVVEDKKQINNALLSINDTFDISSFENIISLMSSVFNIYAKGNKKIVANIQLGIAE